MKKSTLPKLTRYMYVVLELISQYESIRAPRKVLPDMVCDKLKLSDDVLKLTKKNGVSINEDRTGWSLTYLKKAELIDFPKRSDASITKRGQEYLKMYHHIGEIKVRDLMRIDKFKEFYSVKKTPTVAINLSESKSTNDDFGKSSLVDNNQKDLMSIYIDKNIFPDLLRDVLQIGYTVASINDTLSIVKNNNN